MVVKILTAETAANGTVLASSTSVGGDAPNVISTAGGGNFTVSDAQASHGSKSVRVVSTATTDTAIFRYTGFTQLSLAANIYVRFDANPAVNVVIFHIRNSADAIVLALILTPTGTVIVQQRAGATKFTSAALAANTWHRIGIYAAANATTGTAGTVKFRTYLGDSTTAANTYDSGAAFDLGTVALDRVQFGKLINSGGPVNFYADSFRVDDGATDLLPPETVPNTAPTANAGADQTGVEPWATVTLTGSDSDSDGTVTTRAWTQTGGSPTVTLTGTGAVRTFEAPGTIAGTTLTFQYAATDNAGATTTDTMTVAVLPVTERAVIGGVEVPMRIRTT